MGTEYRFQPILEPPSRNETMQFRHSEKKFRPKRAKWACYACHKRKVRCDALNQGTSCTNCRLDMKECVVPPRSKKKAAASSPYVPGETSADDTTLSARVPQHSATLDPKRDDVQSNSAGVSSRKRKSPPRILGSPRTCPQQRRHSGQGSSHNVDNEVGLWMEMLPPNVLEQLELRSTTGSSRPNRHNIDALNAEQFHHKCSEKLLQAVDILTEVIIMHNSLSAHAGHSVPVVHPSADIHCASENQLDYDAKKEENMEYSSFICHQTGEDIWDIDSPLDESSTLTPESLEYVAGSNFNLWLKLNNSDLGSPLSLGPYDIEEAVS
ncbi:hypothetical protein N7524_006033 [Penicillium chrysogenum]|nr:hypothetical protein N7524_006033 [Penicillium chrysogenum]